MSFVVVGVDGSATSHKALVAAVEQPVKARNEVMALKVSCGFALYPGDGLSRAELEEKADKAMYRAKKRGSSPDPSLILH